MTRTGAVLFVAASLVAASLVAALALGLAGPGSAQPILNPDREPGGPGIGGPPPPPPPPEQAPGVDLKEPMWVAVHGQTTGPYDSSAIAQKIVAGEIVAETLVYTASMNRWVRAGDVAALQPLLRQVAERGGRGRPGLPKGPEGGDAQAAQFTEYMLGEWEFDWPFDKPGENTRLYLRYRPDGTFRGYATTTRTGEDGRPESATELRTGTWKVAPINERRFVLSTTFNLGGKDSPLDLPFEILGPSRKRHVESGKMAIRVAN